MILHTIRLHRWAGIEQLELSLFPGANLLHGPNGSGKSTVVGAICRGLFDRHDSRAAELLAVRPWGTCLAPSVALELETGGRVYRVRKQFLEESHCQLEQRQAAGWRLLAEGKQADRALLALLEAPGSKSGASKARDRGISQLLWALQGDVGLPASLSGDTGYALRQSAGQLLEGPASRRVAERLEQAHAEMFRANGTHRKGSVVSRLRRALDSLTARRDELAERVAAGGRSRARAVERAEALEQAQAELRGLQAERLAATEALVRAESHRQRRREAELAYEAAAARWRERSERCGALAQRRAELAATEARLSRIREALAALRAQHAEQAAQTEALAQRSRALRSAWDGIRERQRAERSRAERSAAEERMRALATRIERAAELTCWIQAKRQELALLDPPPAAIRTQLHALQEAPEIGVVFTAQTSRALTVTVDGQVREVSLDAGQQEALRLTGQASLELPGIGRVEVRTAWQEQLRAIRQQCGGRTISELVEVSGRQQALSRELEQLEAELRGLSPGGIDALTESLAQLQQEISALAPVDPRGAAEDAAQLGRCAARAEQDYDEVFGAHEAAVARLAERTASCAELAAEEAGVVAAEVHQQADLARLTADGLPDAERAAALEQAQGQLAASEGRKQELARSREQIEAIPQRRVAGLDRSISRLEGHVTALQAEVHQLRGVLSAGLDAEASAALPTVEAELAETRRQLEREQLRARGLALLHQRYLEAREESIEQVLEPIAERVMADLGRLGQPLRRLSLDRGLAVHRMEVERGVPVEAGGLSHGTWIQLMTLIRLNLGEQLSTREPQLVILDDTLVHSDTVRMSRLMPRLAQAAEHMQLLLVTCQPEQFESLAAKRLELAPSRLVAQSGGEPVRG